MVSETVLPALALTFSNEITTTRWGGGDYAQQAETEYDFFEDDFVEKPDEQFDLYYRGL